MAEFTMKLRAVFAHLPGEDYPTFVGAADADTWEVIPEEDWQPIVQRWKENWLADWESYDYRECFIEVPGVSLALFAAPTLQATAPTKGTNQ